QENNTIIYTPEPEKTGTDEFDYTTSVTNPNDTVSTQTGNVSVTITPEKDDEEQVELNADVAFWKKAFDEEWNRNNFDHAINLAKSSNIDQEYYYLSYYIDGLTSMWRATGDNSYLDTALSLIKTTIKDSQSVGNGFLGWPAKDNVQY